MGYMLKMANHKIDMWHQRLFLVFSFSNNAFTNIEIALDEHHQ